LKCLLVLLPLAIAPVVATAQEPARQGPVLGTNAAGQDVRAPQPTVPEVFTLEGQFVRVAYNNEGFVTLGYRLANDSQGQEWMYLQAGVTLRKPTKDWDMPRTSFSLKTPDGKIIPLATQKEYQAALGLRALNERAKVVNDPMNYFPLDANRGCPLQFFADLGGARGGGLSYDVVGLSYNRACLGRLFFNIPGGIQEGQHWLIVKFPTSEVQVPFRILTKEENKEFAKRWEEFKKAHDESLGLK
jgi:hypothetical protein